MRVKNTGAKTIGLGGIVLPPDAVGDLPEGFGESHPTVGYYLGKKWLTPVNGGGEGAPAETDDGEQAVEGKMPVNEGKEGAPAETGDGEQAEGKTPEEKKAEADARIRAVNGGKMNIEALRGEASALGVEWSEADTKAVLANKITEKLRTEMG